jgi:hypothetical protein
MGFAPLNIGVVRMVATKKVTKRQRRELDFQERVYRALREYQDGKLTGNGTAVGRLDQPLTAVYDRIVEAAKELPAR